MAAVWVIVATVLPLAVEIAAAVLGQVIGRVSVVWVGPLVRSTVLIASTLWLIWLIRTKLNRMPWTGMALPRPQPLRLLLGCLGGALMTFTIFGAERGLGWLRFSGISHMSHWKISMVGFVLLELLPSLGVGFCEELAFRGYIFQVLGERMQLWKAALATSLLFALIHLPAPGFGPAVAGILLLMGLMFVVMRLVTGSLWFPIGFHGLFDWSQTYLLGVSGTAPSLFQFARTGAIPWAWMTPARQDDLIYGLAALLGISLALIYGRLAARVPRWQGRLSSEGFNV